MENKKNRLTKGLLAILIIAAVIITVINCFKPKKFSSLEFYDPEPYVEQVIQWMDYRMQLDTSIYQPISVNIVDTIYSENGQDIVQYVAKHDYFYNGNPCYLYFSIDRNLNCEGINFHYFPKEKIQN